jgi:hypothetical protein
MTVTEDRIELLEMCRKLKRLLAVATPGPWDVYEQPVASPDAAIAELTQLVRGTPEFYTPLPMLTSPGGFSPAVTGCGKESLANARLISAMRNCLPRLLAALENMNAIASAWAQDRSEQYTDESSAKVALEDLAYSFHNGEHLDRFERGEFDDLLPRPYR